MDRGVAIVSLELVEEGEEGGSVGGGVIALSQSSEARAERQALIFTSHCKGIGRELTRRHLCNKIRSEASTRATPRGNSKIKRRGK